ncbi:MAG TPA: hypothetical protein VL651_02820 [Bacteroidia bacterium]|jgi:hypothetical protein|nr:hypothetical protein [Bacteroidia bacterium]
MNSGKTFSLALALLLLFSFRMKAEIRDTLKGVDQNNSIEDNSVSNEVGFDMAFFLNIFRSQYEPTVSTLFSLSYNRELSEKYELRSTFGMGYADFTTQSLNQPSLLTKNNQEDFKIGLARKTPCYKRWVFYYGVDWEFQNGFASEQSLTIVGADQCIMTNTTRLLLTGPGPFSGLIFFINPRISLNIESNLNFVYTKNADQSDYTVHPEMNTSLTSKGFTSEFTIPQSLFLNIKF